MTRLRGARALFALLAISLPAAALAATAAPAQAVSVPVLNPNRNSFMDAKAKALGGGKVQFTVNGHPDVAGYANVYSGSTRIGHVRTDSHGDKVFTVQSRAGRRTFDLYFQAPGCTLSRRQLTGTVR